MKRNKNSHTKILMLHNPAHSSRFHRHTGHSVLITIQAYVRGYSAQDLERDKQSGFTQHLVSEIIRRWRINTKDSELSAGFIPMLIMIVLVLAAFIWLVYSRVSHTGQ